MLEITLVYRVGAQRRRPLWLRPRQRRCRGRLAHGLAHADLFASLREPYLAFFFAANFVLRCLRSARSNQYTHHCSCHGCRRCWHSVFSFLHALARAAIGAPLTAASYLLLAHSKSSVFLHVKRYATCLVSRQENSSPAPSAWPHVGGASPFAATLRFLFLLRKVGLHFSAKGKHQGCSNPRCPPEPY